MYLVGITIFEVVHTEAERRRREAGVQQAMENGLWGLLHQIYLPR